MVTNILQINKLPNRKQQSANNVLKSVWLCLFGESKFGNLRIPNLFCNKEQHFAIKSQFAKEATLCSADS